VSEPVLADGVVQVFSAGTPMTFLMTDVEGSTRLWEQQRDSMAASLATHDGILRAAVAGHGGAVFKTTGDGILATFKSAVDAVAAAAEIQRQVGRERWPTSEPIRVRIALHTGEAQAREGDFFGPPVNRTARLLAIGHGGQVLISAATAELARDELPADLTLVDQGEHRLRDLDRPERVFQLTASDLNQSFPPLRSQSTRTNLPAQLTSFVGRQRELGELRELASGHRLVTLTGVGGTGKTRLLLELATEFVDRYTDGVWLAELASINDPDLIAGQIARATGISDEPGRAAIDTLTDFVRDKSLLILLDNCEHLIAAAGAIVETLITGAPRLAVMASSREALGLAGELIYHVPSLGLPQRPEDADASEAVRLFVERATVVLPSFRLTQANAPAVVEICRRLDGIPLAIELAAARVTVLSVDEISARLGDRFRLLTGGSRSALPRQQTLQALVDWSWNLLSEEDQRLLGRLSVFSGGWTLEAAASVTASAGSAPDMMNTLDGLSRLVDRSLVQVEHGESTRYRLLETIRQYARDRLVASGEADPVRLAHLDYFLRLALGAQSKLLGPDMVDWLGRLDAEIDNLRAALDFGMEADVARAIQMLVALMPFWRVRAFGSEALDRITRAADITLESPNAMAGEEGEVAVLTARITAAASQIHGSWGNPMAAVRYGDEALRRARVLGDDRTLLEALTGRAMGYVFSGDVDAALKTNEELAQLAASLDDSWTQAMVELGRGMLDLTTGNIAGALERMERATDAATRSGNPFTIGFSALNRGRMAGFLRNAAEARIWFAKAKETYDELGDRRFELVATSDLAHALRRSGELNEAEALYRTTISEWVRLGNRAAIANQLESVALIAAARNELPRSARLFGAAEALREAAEAPMLPIEAIEYKEAVATLRTKLPQPALHDAWQEGRAMSADRAVQFAIMAAP
jgi:predicted ATPase/class 3 adenylate cyclase